MQKILDLSEKEFLTGISPSAQVQDKGLWAEMRGTTVVRDFQVGNNEVGLLQGAFDANADSLTLADSVFAYTRDITGSTDQAYFIGDQGHLYSYDISAGTATDKRTATPIAAAANGIEIFKPRGGTKYLYYWQATQIGRWDMTGSHPTGWTDNWATGLQSTTWHPTHRLFDRIYYGNLNYIGYIGDDGAAAEEHVKDALDLSMDYRVNCLTDDGFYLVAGLSTNTSTFAANEGRTKVIFWDHNSSSWQREWDIPDSAILGIRKGAGGVLYAVCTHNIYDFTFSTPPSDPAAGPFSSGYLPSFGAGFPTQHSVATIGGAILWSSGFTSPTMGDVSSYGRLSPQAPKAYLRPFAGLPGQPHLIAPDIVSNTLFIGQGLKLFRAAINGDGTGALASGTGTYAKTIFIDLQRWYQIGRAVVEFDKPLESADSIQLALTPDQGTNATTFGTVTGGSIRTKEFYKSLDARKVALTIFFYGGNPKIRRIQLFGDPIERATH